MIEVSWPLSTVPTREKVKCRIWLFNRGRFFFSSMANSYNTRHQVKEDHSGKWSKVDREKTTTEGLCERTICYIFLSLLISGFSDQFSLNRRQPNTQPFIFLTQWHHKTTLAPWNIAFSLQTLLKQQRNKTMHQLLCSNQHIPACPTLKNPHLSHELAVTGHNSPGSLISFNLPPHWLITSYSYSCREQRTSSVQSSLIIVIAAHLVAFDTLHLLASKRVALDNTH